MTDKPDLAALLGSRICHDLISPIGAISNGVELLAMEGKGPGPEMALISDSVAHANARIRFFRLAFGAAGADHRIGRTEVTTILSDLTRGGRTQIGWTSPADLARGEAKLAFLALQICETAMPWGGRVEVAQDGARWTVQAAAPRLRVDPALWEVLSNPAAPHEVTPAEVHFLLLAEELPRQNRRLTVDVRETEIRLAF